MAFVCESVSASGECLAWAEAVVVPPLTVEQGAGLAAIIVPVLILAAALRMVREFVVSSANKG